jgi:hypothetical protein
MSVRQGHIAEAATFDNLSVLSTRRDGEIVAADLEAGRKVSAIDGQDGTRHIRADPNTSVQRTLEFRQLSDAALWNPVNQLLAEVTGVPTLIE